MSSKRYKIKINETFIEVTEEQYNCYYRAERRMRYFEHDIKIETAIRGEDGIIIEYRPSKEVPLEYILAAGVEFAYEQESVEDIVINSLILDKLNKSLDKLNADERQLVEALFFSNGGRGMSEREYAKISGIPRKTIAYRRKKIMNKLKNHIID